MNCNSAHSLFLRSNGDLVCWDDRGSFLTLLAFDPSVDYAADVYLGPLYNGIRDKLRAGQMPFPEHCSGCFCLMHHLRLGHEYEERKLVETFQIEPSMACQLECPNCATKAERPVRVKRTPYGHLNLAPHIVEKIVADLHRGGISVQKFDFQGHGEPLLNRRTWDMAKFIAGLYPNSIVSICSNSNFEFRPEMVRSGVNEMLFAIDGMDQASYAPYRVAGDFDAAYGFMKDFSQAAASENPAIRRVWKYVVFEHNDQPAQLLRAQELALEAKVTELRFVLTQMGPVSWDVTDESQVPRLDPALNVVVDNYRIRLEQFETALHELATAIVASDVRQADQSAAFFVNMLNRYFERAPRISPEHHMLMERFLNMSYKLPLDLGRARRDRIDAIRAEVRARARNRGRNRPSLTVIDLGGCRSRKGGASCGAATLPLSEIPPAVAAYARDDVRRRVVWHPAAASPGLTPVPHWNRVKIASGRLCRAARSGKLTTPSSWRRQTRKVMGRLNRLIRRSAGQSH